MLLTIIPSDNAVYKNGVSFPDLQLTGVPADVHALQWHENSGWIEYNTEAANESISELPQWAIDAAAKWDEAKTTEDTVVAEQSTPLTYEQKLVLVRLERNRRIAATDWTQAGDVVRAHSAEWTQAWEAYRQALRDLPGTITESTINTFTYPTPPDV